jgi:flavorubredoxin
MHVLVVYESMFGNTQQIAGAVAEGLEPYARVELVEVSDAATGGLDRDVDLLVVGGPTHAMGLSRPGSRQSATQQAADGVVSGDTGLREWLAEIHLRRGLPVAAFDTRFDKPVLMVGSAARGAAKRLRRAGCALIGTPESFFVAASLGPLREGELERARRWGASIGAQVASTLRKNAS